MENDPRNSRPPYEDNRAAGPYTSPVGSSAGGYRATPYTPPPGYGGQPVQSPPPYAAPPPGYRPVQIPPYGSPAYPPAFTPPVDNTKPLLVTTSRRMNLLQFSSLYRQSRDKKRDVLLWVLLGVCAVLFLYAAFCFGMYTKDVQTYLFIAIEFLALCGSGAVLLCHRRRVGRDCAAAFACYTESEPAEGVIELYGDHAVARSSRSETTIYFYQVLSVTEKQDMVGICAPGVFIAWRAEDLTPGEAQLLLGCLSYSIRPGYYRRNGVFTPWQVQPLLRPAGQAAEEIWLSVPVEESCTLPFGVFIGRLLRGQALALLPLLFLTAGQLAIKLFITPHLLLDYAIYTGILILCIVGVLVLVDGPLYVAGKIGVIEGGAPVRYAFTPSGLTVQARGNTFFVDKRYVRIRTDKKGVLLATPRGDFYIPWEAVDDPDALRTIVTAG